MLTLTLKGTDAVRLEIPPSAEARAVTLTVRPRCGRQRVRVSFEAPREIGIERCEPTPTASSTRERP